MAEASAITAVLGPTNTGKTHRAIERMLSYDSGIIGLPLRLLAREVYDRITAKIGESRVALVTGEEKRVPKRPAYWVCTVEAMPSIDVEFVAVDEIQLASHDQRGHVFTDRILRARGSRETWLLGADTMRQAVEALVPTAKIASHPRLSKLSYRGADSMGKIPPRSAVVGFSATQVFELGERIRSSRGGAAIVLGALSPRTRNAQVAMFQAGEVDYLVATDAIGMGLNLDIVHVAFSALRKFDGRNVRDLEPAELAQIAGRAGRHVRDGSFGTLGPMAMDDDVAHAIEAHRFAPVARLWWRNPDVDFASPEALLASLRVRARSKWLRLGDDAEDVQALERMMADPLVRARARGEEGVQLLWDVCRIPDYRKLLVETHVALLGEVFRELAGPSAALSDDWMDRHVRAIDDTSGDIETLTDRIAKIRTFTFLANQGRWVASTETWQAETRAVEDRLSDALHDRLVQRFVEKKSKKGRVSPGKTRSVEATQDPPRVDPQSPFARLLHLRAQLAPAPPESEIEDDAWVESLVAAKTEAFSIDEKATIRWGERVVGKLVRGEKLLLPNAKLANLDDLGAGAKMRIQRRLSAYAREAVDELLEPLRSDAASHLSAPARGVVYLVERGLGTACAPDALATLSVHDREALARLGVVAGDFVAFVRALVRPERLAVRRALVHAFFGHVPKVPPRGATSVPIERGVDAAAYLATGWVVLGPGAVRADVAEKLAPHVRAQAVDPKRAASTLGCSVPNALAVIDAMATLLPVSIRDDDGPHAIDDGRGDGPRSNDQGEESRDCD